MYHNPAGSIQTSITGSHDGNKLFYCNILEVYLCQKSHPKKRHRQLEKNIFFCSIAALLIWNSQSTII